MCECVWSFSIGLCDEEDDARKLAWFKLHPTSEEQKQTTMSLEVVVMAINSSMREDDDRANVDRCRDVDRTVIANAHAELPQRGATSGHSGRAKIAPSAALSFWIYIASPCLYIVTLFYRLFLSAKQHICIAHLALVHAFFSRTTVTI